MNPMNILWSQQAVSEQSVFVMLPEHGRVFEVLLLTSASTEATQQPIAKY